MTNDTIASIATAPGKSGIAIVRVSGPRSIAIVDTIFSGSTTLNLLTPNSFVYGHISTESTVLDEVIVLVYKKPHSYTREDVVEIQGHGGTVSAKRILRALFDAGVRPADPGEFTKRAFLNGRIDLLQAEAVMDLINAQSDRAAAGALEQLKGTLSDIFEEIYDRLMSIAANLESTLDFSDEELPESAMSQIKEELATIVEDLRIVLTTWEEGHLLREGALLVIAGKPNVGKSTLMNCLLQSNRAIVANTPGTTRDTIEEQVIINGVVIRLVDTAGLRESDCAIEREGVSRAQSIIGRADMIIYVIDASCALTESDCNTLNSLCKNKPCIIMLNKNDLGKQVQPEQLSQYHCISSTLLNNEGIAELHDAISHKLTLQEYSSPHATISERHRNIVQQALKEMDTAMTLLDQDQDDLIVPTATHLRSALETLGTITGKQYHDKLLETVFSRFCIGK